MSDPTTALPFTEVDQEAPVPVADARAHELAAAQMFGLELLTSTVERLLAQPGASPFALPEVQRVEGRVAADPVDVTAAAAEAIADAIDARLKPRFDELGRVIAQAFADAMEKLPRARFATGGSGFPDEALVLLRQIAAGGVGPVVPVGALLAEDGDPLLTEDGAYLLTED